MANRRPLHTCWYDHPRLCNIAFRSETPLEADFIEAACRKYCGFAAKRLLEPGCGSGRLVVEMAGRGYRVTGFDLNRPSLDYLRRRLARRGLRADVFEADMADFRLSRPVDAAFCTVNTFRHLLSEQSARRHLKCIAQSLRPGGIYILGFHLLPMDASEEDIERWTERQGGTQVTVTLRVLATDRRRRIERLRLSLLRADQGERGATARRVHIPHVYDRSIPPAPGECAIVGVSATFYDFWYEIDNPLELNDDRADTVFVLRKCRC